MLYDIAVINAFKELVIYFNKSIKYFDTLLVSLFSIS